MYHRDLLLESSLFFPSLSKDEASSKTMSLLTPILVELLVDKSVLFRFWWVGDRAVLKSCVKFNLMSSGLHHEVPHFTSARNSV